MEKRKQIFPVVLRRQVILIVVSQMESSSEGLGLPKWTDSFDIKAYFRDEGPFLTSTSPRGRKFSSVYFDLRETHEWQKWFNRVKNLKHKPENQQTKITWLTCF